MSVPTAREIVETFAASRTPIGKELMPASIREKLIADCEGVHGDALINLIESRFSTWERHGK